MSTRVFDLDQTGVFVLVQGVACVVAVAAVAVDVAVVAVVVVVVVVVAVDISKIVGVG